MLSISVYQFGIYMDVNWVFEVIFIIFIKSTLHDCNLNHQFRFWVFEFNLSKSLCSLKKTAFRISCCFSPLNLQTKKKTIFLVGLFCLWLIDICIDNFTYVCRNYVESNETILANHKTLKKLFEYEDNKLLFEHEDNKLMCFVQSIITVIPKKIFETDLFSDSLTDHFLRPYSDKQLN